MRIYNVTFKCRVATGTLDKKKVKEKLRRSGRILTALADVCGGCIPEENASFAVGFGVVREVKLCEK